MSFSRLVRQLRREVTKHPKKAAILGVLCLAALWFWVPLVWGWIDKGDTSTKPAAGREPSPASAAASAPGRSATLPTAAATKGNITDGQKYPWHQLVRWMDNDPRTAATNPMAGRRDPFLIPQDDAVPAETATELGRKALEATPEGWGMVLSGTIVGLHRRAAQINGKSYRQGETVKLAKNGQQIEFTLAAVHPRRIVLQHKGRQFELTLPAPARAPTGGWSGRIELSRDGQ